MFLRECERLEHAENECRQKIKLLKSKLTHLVGTSNPEKCSLRKLKPELDFSLFEICLKINKRFSICLRIVKEVINEIEKSKKELEVNFV